MKNSLFFLLVLFPTLLIGQITQTEITKDLPLEAKYELVTSDFYTTGFNKKRRKWNGKEEIGDSINLGCSKFEVNGVPIAFMFSVFKKNKREEFPMRLYAIKRVDYQWDEEVINALEVYCYYGQWNYYFLTKDYILFTYMIGGDAFAIAYPKLMMKIQNQLVKNLNELK